MKKRRKRKPKADALAVVPKVAPPVPPPPTMGDASAMYVRVPMPPPVLAAMQRYHSLYSELVGLFGKADEAAREFVDGLERARDEVERATRGRRRR